MCHWNVRWNCSQFSYHLQTSDFNYNWAQKNMEIQILVKRMPSIRSCNRFNDTVSHWWGGRWKNYSFFVIRVGKYYRRACAGPKKKRGKIHSTLVLMLCVLYIQQFSWGDDLFWGMREFIHSIYVISLCLFVFVCGSFFSLHFHKLVYFCIEFLFYVKGQASN